MPELDRRGCPALTVTSQFHTIQLRGKLQGGFHDIPGTYRNESFRPEKEL